MAQVIDASIAVAWCAHSQASPLTYAALAAVSQSGAHVPSPFWYEVLYALSGLELRRIIRATDVDDFMADAMQMDFSIDPGHDTTAAVHLHHMARRHRLSIYDASYLELALRLRLPLATRDASLARAAEESGVALFTA